MLKNSILKVLIKPKWVWVLTLMSIIGFSLASNIYVQSYFNIDTSFFDVLFSQINQTDMVGIPMLIIFLLFNIDKSEKNIVQNNKMFRQDVFFSIINVLVFFSLFYIINILVYTLSSKPYMYFRNSWEGIHILKLINITPWTSCLVSFFLLSLRFTFISLVIRLVDLLVKEPIGFIIALFISYADIFLYRILGIKSIGILPYEHTILNDETISKLFYSFVYWAVLILITGSAVFLQMKKASLFNNKLEFDDINEKD